MYAEIHDKLRNAIKLPASRIVVYDEYDNPIAVVVQIEGAQYIAATAANKNFNKILNALGINKTLVVTHLSENDLNSSAKLI